MARNDTLNWSIRWLITIMILMSASTGHMAAIVLFLAIAQCPIQATVHQLTPLTPSAKLTKTVSNVPDSSTVKCALANLSDIDTATRTEKQSAKMTPELVDVHSVSVMPCLHVNTLQ